MIDVQDIATLSTLPDAVPLSACQEWLGRGVREVAVMDAEPLTGDYQAFAVGDAVFTSLGFSGGQPGAIDEALIRLLQRDVACVFVKDTFPYEPSEAVLAESRCRRIPVFRYRAGLIEQIISEARALIAEDARDDRTEAAVHGLMSTAEGEEARSALRALLPGEGGYVQAAFLVLGEGDKLVAGALKSHVAAAFDVIPARLVTRFESGLLALFSSSDASGLLSENDAGALVAGFGSRIHVGLSEVLPSEQVPTVLAEARAAGRHAESVGAVDVAWSSMGRAAFQAARPVSPLVERACAAGKRRLQAWDAERKGDLERSMAVYVACGGDINRTAETLCQHPNSVRNRLAHTREALSLGDATDKELFAYLSMVYL